MRENEPMASSDWSTVTGSSDASTIVRNVVAVPGALPAPPGAPGYTHVYGARAVSAGVFALYTNQVDFAPIDPAKSAQVTIALRAHGGAQPFAFAALQGDGDVADAAYRLGIDSSGYLTLSKGALSEDLSEPTKILRHATTPIAEGTWIHARLDVVANGNGDNVLNVYTSSSGSILAPTWERAFDRYIDDALAVASGSKPLRGGYLGFGAKLPAGARAYFVEVGVQRGS